MIDFPILDNATLSWADAKPQTARVISDKIYFFMVKQNYAHSSTYILTIKLIKYCIFFDFVNLEIHSKLIFTDSGTVQEEALIFKKICIILRESTERPETIEAGSGILYKNNLNNIIATIKHSLNTKKKIDMVEEYFYEDVSNKIINIMLSE